MDRKSHFTFFHTDFVESDCFTWVKNFTWFVSACSITIVMQNESHILHGFAVCSGYLTFVCAFISLAFKTWIYRTRSIYMVPQFYMVLQLVAVGYLPLVFTSFHNVYMVLQLVAAGSSSLSSKGITCGDQNWVSDNIQLFQC